MRTFVERIMPLNSNIDTNVTVVIPIYRIDLSHNERWAVGRNLSILRADRDIAVVCPEGLDLSPVDDLLGLTEGRCRVERFDASFFAGRIGYNKLMLGREFYSRFANSQFVMICQADVALLRDDLDYWCSLDYDYIGAPWLPALGDIEGWNVIRRGIFWIRTTWAKWRGGFRSVLFKWKVGNGGLSLRRVSAMLRVINAHAEELAEIATHADKTENFEDVVLSLRVNEMWNERLHIPDAATAAHFSIEGHPETALRLTGGEMPMGTHAFFRRRNRKFWKKHLDFPCE